MRVGKKRENKKGALHTLFHNFFCYILEQFLQIQYFYVAFQDEYHPSQIKVKSSQLCGYSIFSVIECHMLFWIIPYYKLIHQKWVNLKIITITFQNYIILETGTLFMHVVFRISFALIPLGYDTPHSGSPVDLAWQFLQLNLIATTLHCLFPLTDAP